MRVPRSLFLSILLLALTALGYAQATATGSFVGRVTDQTGKEVGGATVTASNTATHFSRTVEVTSTGYYAVPGLPPGRYDVHAEAKGFGTQTLKVSLSVGDAQEANFTLFPPAADVDRSFESQPLQPTRTDVSTVVTGLDLRLLPVFASARGGINDFAQLALITPGMRLDTSSDSFQFGADGTDLIGPGAVNYRYNQYNLTGANITDQLFSGRDGVGASVEEVQQFQVLAANYDAQYGQAGGFLLNAVTKSGSNAYHGDGHVYFRGRNLQASNPFYNVELADAGTPIAGAPRQPFHRQEGGFNIGGPLIKDRLFWFANFEISHQGSPVPVGAATFDQPTNNQLYSGRLDYKISEHNTAFVRVAYEHFLTDNVFEKVDESEVLANTSLVSVLTSHLVNQAGFSFFHVRSDLALKDTQPTLHDPPSFLRFDLQGPQSGVQKRYQFFDNLTWTHGRHTVKAGLDLSVYPWSALDPEFHFGMYTVNAAGAPTSFTIGIGPGSTNSRDTLVGLFLQDSWRLTPKLTLNYGLRYDVEAGAFHGGALPGAGGCVQGNAIISACSSDHNNFQPRVGLAWAPWEHTVVRASFAETTQTAVNDLALHSLLFDGVGLATYTTNNPFVLAAFPNAPNLAVLAAAIAPLGFGSVRPMSGHLHNPEVRSFNLAVEHQFGSSFTATVQYLGQFGFGLFGEDDLNAPPVLPDPAHPGFFFYGNRPDPNFQAVRTVDNSRTSHYNGLLVTVNKRFSRHVQFLANYTWSHSITSADDFFISEPATPGSIRPEMADALNDVRHAANFGVILDSGKMTEDRVKGWFVNDVTLSFLGQLQSARPYNLSTGTSGFLGESFFGLGNGTQQRPTVLPDGTLSSAGIASFSGQNALFGPGAVASCIA
ncbi:MAG TPA: TonB-dependent receptor, partial [Terriglobales bacterium]|nr:TonB-dependent receptor [Terriglobales bacterium]